MSDSLNRLDILITEKRKLRANKIRLNEIHHHSRDDLQRILNISKLRAMELIALSEFQRIPSIGIRFAHDLISLGFYSLKDIQGKDPAKLTDRYERLMGVWMDPCVEDQFRLVTYYANHPSESLNWWDFTRERKNYRQKHGYPSTRPKKPWFELARFKRSQNINAKGTATKVDLLEKLKLSLEFMKKNYSDHITLNELATNSHLSPFHFQRVFKNAYEVTPLQYLTRLRMKKACRFLTKTKISVSTIGSNCGFENQSSFIRQFKKEFKVTPGSYRKSKTIPFERD
jgi:AraC-like DNA-binding protein